VFANPSPWRRYTLELKSTAPEKAGEVKAFVAANFAGAEPLEEYAGFFKYRVEQVPPLADVFRVLESAREPLAIEEYSFSQPSLEMIFLDFAKEK
jgi:hypothetical protein